MQSLVLVNPVMMVVLVQGLCKSNVMATAIRTFAAAAPPTRSSHHTVVEATTILDRKMIPMPEILMKTSRLVFVPVVDVR